MRTEGFRSDANVDRPPNEPLALGTIRYYC
jgi:hypothetical protein